MSGKVDIGNYWLLWCFNQKMIKKKQNCSTQKLSLNFIYKLPKNITPNARNYQKPSTKSERWENGNLAISTIKRHILGEIVK